MGVFRPRVAAFIAISLVCAARAFPADEILPSPEEKLGQESGSSIRWKDLFKESLLFLGVEHSFRIATDPGVRDGFRGSFVGGYVDSVENLHGWADGDPALVNYVGHPLQGSTSGYLWVHNDLRYRTAEIGSNRRYWTGRLRAMAFAWAYSEQFEIGPLSEATLSHDQGHFPQQGFVDHVITPVVGIGWMVAEDAVDRFVIKPIENHTRHPLLKIMARGFLNPSRSFANAMELEVPWNRETRPGVFETTAPESLTPDRQVISVTKSETETEAKVPSFEFATNFNQMLLGAGTRNVACSGGGGSGVFNLNFLVGIEADVSGCKMLGLESNLSGDALTFAAGPRFSFRNSTHWTPWVNVLIGGEKLTEERMNPQLRAALLASQPAGSNPMELHAKYTTDYDAAGFRLSFGGGVDWTLNRVVAFRVGNLQYSHTWMRDLNGETYPGDLRLTTGFVLRIGG